MLHELEVKNFSWWSAEIHKPIYSQWREGPVPLVPLSILRLYPKGVDGKGDHLVVIIEKWRYGDISELSFIASDGSAVICTRRPLLDSKEDKMSFEGPKFEDVVAGIRANEPEHKDRLIVRWDSDPKTRRFLKFRVVIEARSASFQIKPEVFEFEEQRGDPKKPEWHEMHVICFRFKNTDVSIHLKACKTGLTLEETSLNFKLKAYTNKKIPARISIWMLSIENITQKYEQDCLIGDKYHTVPYGVPLKDLSQTTIRCKYITGHTTYHIGFTTALPLSPSIRITNFKSVPRESQQEKTVAVFTKELACLYKNQDCSDFKLRCGTVSFPTHRGILSARSPVFKAMLSAGMREATAGHVDIEDMDPDTIGRFLAFLYSGSIGDEALGWEEAIRLYQAADKYQVPSLKEVCATVLRASVSLENVCDILSLVDSHLDGILRSVAHDFILKNYHEVMKSENWAKFMSSEPFLAVRTLTHFGEREYLKRTAF